MPTLEQQRRAIGAANEAARRAIGTNNEAARRAIGVNNAAERRGEQLVDDINRTIRPERAGNNLPTVEPRGAQAARRGRGSYVPPATSASGGIASPLAEADAATREYWPTGLKSSDGLFEIPAIKLLKLTDANGAEVEVQLADPGASA